VLTRLRQFFLEEPRQTNVLSIAAAIILAEAVVGFLRTITNAIATPLILAIYSQASREELITRESTLASAVQIAVGAVVNLGLAAIAIYVIARWSVRRAEREAVDDNQ
jgi:large-conductance mechanosensitive channel